MNDLLKFDNTDNVKIRFNMSNGGSFDPIKLFKEDKQSLLNGHFHNYSKKSYKEGNIAIGLARIENDKWLLFDISIITKDLNKFNEVGYEYQTMVEYEKYFGRVIINYHNTATNLIRNAESVIKDCEVVQILEDTFDNVLFTGYENVHISWIELNRVIKKIYGKLHLKIKKEYI